MSYILDALKRSERERTLGDIPKLSRPIEDTSGRGMQIAAYLVLALLLLAGAVFAFQQSNISVSKVAANIRDSFNSVINSGSGLADKAVDTTVQTPNAVAVNINEEQQQEVLQHNQASAAPKPDIGKLRTKLANQTFARNAQAQRDLQTQDVGNPATSTSGKTDAASVSQPAQSISQPTNKSAENVSQELPGGLASVTLDVHSYSNSANRRFVMIDQSILKEGAVLKNGARLEEITQQGAIVSLNGERYLIRP